MMATSMGPNFTGHPAAMGHPAVAGHPMGPGMPPNAGQQGAPGGGMPHQFAGGPMGGVSGPGGQVNPALMGGMPPGANPGGHPLQHLNPAQQQQMLQQQQQHLQGQFANPQMANAIRQQQLLAQQQQRQQAMMAHQFNPNMAGGMNMPMGMQFNPQQLQQLRQSGRLGPAQQAQAQAMMAQQLAMQQHQQQQQAQAQAQQQQQQNQQPGPHGQQVPGGPNPGQTMPMNMQNMQQQQQGQMGGPGQNPMGGQPGQHPQGQPQPQQQQQLQQPQPQPQPQQQPQPHPQPPQQPIQRVQTPQQSQAGTPAPGQHTPSQTPAQTPVQPQAQPPPQVQGQPQPPPVQPQSQQQQQPQPQQQQQQQMGAVQQHYAMNNMLLQQQQRRESMKSQCLLRLMQFSEHLSAFPPALKASKDDLTYWNMFVNHFFSPAAIFRLSLHITDTEDPQDRLYEITFPAIARFFHSNFNSGVKSMQLILDKGTKDSPLPGDCHCVENPKSSLVYWFDTGSHLISSGSFRAQFDADQKIELFEFFTTSHEEYVSRKQVIDAAKPAHVWMKEWNKMNFQDNKQSPEMPKKSKSKQFKSPNRQPPEVLSDLPETVVNSKGVTDTVHQFLEIVEVMGQMNPLFSFYHGNPGMGPYKALEQYVATQTGPQQVNGQPMPPGSRAASFGQFPMGASPAAAHMNLPGSPHIGGSPIPGHMQAPGMALQASQQGTSSSGPSANTSPAASNKRRRPSGVKAEDDGSGAPTPGAAGGAQVNGAQGGRGKPATPRMTKRAKGNPANAS